MIETALAKSVDSLLEVFFDSETVDHLAQRLVHEFDLVPGQITGVFVFSVTAKSELKYLGGFGSSSLSDLTGVSIWDEHPLGQAVRAGKPFTHKSTKDLPENLVCIPLIRGRVPNGVLVFQYPELPVTKQQQDDVVWSTISTLGGYFLAIQGQSARRVGFSSGNNQAMPEELSSRQLDVLKLIGDGLNNAEIAQKVLVSESTVRQETIKIYRILGVGNRHEAMVKGRAIGLIPALQDSTDAPPPEALIRVRAGV